MVYVTKNVAFAIQEQHLDTSTGKTKSPAQVVITETKGLTSNLPLHWVQ
jgi:hypothetical protein